MPGEFNGTTLKITATPKNGAALPDIDSGTNVAGIAIVGSDMFCVKTSGQKTTLLKTTNYTEEGATAVKVASNLPYFALGLTKIDSYLYMLAETKAQYGGTTRIVKLDTSGKVKGEFDINSIFKNGALGITHTGKDNEFFILAYGVGSNSSSDTLTIKRITWGGTVSETFTIKNKGYGYTYQLQDIYYHLDYGLFILTNNNLNSGENKIIVVDYVKGKSSYTPGGVITVNLPVKEYNQYNLESICMKANHLVLAANIKLSDDTSKDRFSVLEGITYADGNYYFNCALKKGMMAPNQPVPGTKLATTNFGTIAFDQNNNLYGIKAGSNNKYASASGCYANLFKLLNYTAATGTIDNIYDIQPSENGCLYHANGMDINNGDIYVACGEKDELGKRTFVKMGMNGYFKARYSCNYRTNAISAYSGNQFIVFTDTGSKTYGNRRVYQLLVGTFNDSTKQFNVSKTFYFLNTGYGVIQDIYYRPKYGLFVVTCESIEFEKDKYQTTENRVLHLNLSRSKSLVIKKDANDVGVQANVIIPDFAFNYVRKANEYFSFEMESVTVDPVSKNMIVAVNANNLDAKHTGEDYVYTFTSIKFN